MRVLPHVTVVGDTTEGALSSQFPESMPNGWTLWVAFKEIRDHDGVCWDGVGIPPDLRVSQHGGRYRRRPGPGAGVCHEVLGKGTPALQDEAKSLVDVKKSLVDEYVRLAKDKGVEAAVAMLNRERTARSGMYFFAPDEAMQQAVPFLGRRQYAEAIGLLRACREDFPTLAHTYAMLAQAYIGLKDVASAEASMKEGEKVEPMFSWETAADRAGQARAAQGQAGFRRRALRQGPGRRRHPGRGKEAERVAETAADGPVFDENDFNDLGYQFLQENKLESAVYVFEKNVRLYPESWNAWDSLGEIAAKAGRKEQAIASYRKSLDLNPKNKNGQAMLEQLEKGK